MRRVAGLRLPTGVADWRLMGRTARLVLSLPAYAALAAAYASLALTLFVFSRNLSVLWRVVLFGDLPLDARAGVFLAMYPGLGSAYTLAATVVLLGTAALVGVDLSMVTYHVREHGAALRDGSGGAAGAVLGTLGAGCASCGSAVLAGLLSAVGATGLLAALPLDGLEFAVPAVGALLLSVFWVADGMRGGDVAGCPVAFDDG